MAGIHKSVRNAAQRVTTNYQKDSVKVTFELVLFLPTKARFSLSSFI